MITWKNVQQSHIVQSFGFLADIPLVESASESELRDIAETLKLGINDEELKEYTGVLSKHTFFKIFCFSIFAMIHV